MNLGRTLKRWETVVVGLGLVAMGAGGAFVLMRGKSEVNPSRAQTQVQRPLAVQQTEPTHVRETGPLQGQQGSTSSVSIVSDDIPAPQDNTNEIIDRWFPRLTDRSIDLREEAVSRLAAIALSDPGRRNSLTATLIHTCRTESTQRIHYEIFDATAKIPLRHAEWVDPFLDLYLDFGNANCESIMYRFVFRRLWGLIASGRVSTDHPRYGEVLDLARKAARLGDGETRAVGVKILDLPTVE